MAISWTLRRADGDTRRFDQWGIKSASLSQVNSVAGGLTLGFGIADLLGGFPLDPAETVLVLADDVPFFRGRVNGETRGAYGSNEGLLLPLADPWWYLEQLIYQVQQLVVTNGTVNPVPANPGGLTISDFPTTTKIISEIIIGQDQTRRTVNSRAQVIDVLNFAIAKGAPIAIGTIDPGIAMPRDLATDITCAEMIRKSLRWTPDQSAWWDYSVNPPALNIRARSNRPLLSIDIADENTAQVEINPRRDLFRTGVRINYLRRHQRASFEFITVDQDDAGANPAGIGSLVVTLELFGSYLNNGFLVAQEPTPAGLAQRLYDTYSVLPFQGRILLVGDDIDPAIRYLGRTLAILGGAPDWAAARMDIQQVTQDLFFGRTEISVGPANQLGPTDLVGLVRQGRTIAPTFADIIRNIPIIPDIPPVNVDPRLEFGPLNPPDVILGRRIDRQVGGGIITCIAEDEIDVYDSPETGNFVATVVYSDLLSLTNEGGTAGLYGIVFGRAHQINGFNNTTCGGGTGIEPRRLGRVYQSTRQIVPP